jgi:glycosyltransferase involved in cell wall biosynthesis
MACEGCGWVDAVFSWVAWLLHWQRCPECDGFLLVLLPLQGHPPLAQGQIPMSQPADTPPPALLPPTSAHCPPTRLTPPPRPLQVEGKARAREELRKRTNLSGWGDKLLVGVVSRLTPQKGVHLIKHAAFRAVERGAQFVLLGSAPDPKLQAEFDELANEMQGSDAAFRFTFDEPLSHLIYAACDIIVVPSMFEPCGLTQMIAMRYGAVPVVRHTGAWRDGCVCSAAGGCPAVLGRWLHACMHACRQSHAARRRTHHTSQL